MMADKKKKQNNTHECGEKCEVYSRVCGYFRPVSNWNKGKQEEYKDRLEYIVKPTTCCCGDN